MPETATFFNSIIESAIDAIIVIDRNGIISELNGAACQLFAYERDELKGVSVNTLMPEFHASRHDGYLKNYIETGKAKIIGVGREVEGKRKDGSLFPARLAVTKIGTSDEIYFAGFLNDLTAIKQAEASIMKLNEELEATVADRTEELSDAVNTLLEINNRLEREVRERQAVERELINSRGELEEALNREKELNELKSRFVSMASHEFRTPLSTILSSAALIGRYTTTEQQPNRDKHLKKIKSAVNGLNGILNDFLSISKIEEGRIGVTISSFPVRTAIREVISDIEGLLKVGQKLTHIDETGDLEIATDRNILKNSLYNLSSNAIKYSGENTTIECRTRIDDDHLVIDVNDQGMGIPMVEQKHLFSRFFRASNVTNIQGTGLGLNIVAGYVKMLGGSIDFESIEEEGTTFTLRIPLNLTYEGQNPGN